ncbi:methyltransferase domain-containing protein [Sphingomonas solaris]|uniref:Methyltransferase domain-containing protein n=1 Tax=Alterirhizorhabdus solaris TaxID=2529389 RepID=A0A558R7M4_9SPHN|nr:methyltransferase domain-containing protein [Sphingomonas solaris]TVV75399.1 methyltransferase domain-containing protein [Sphingomonas solaris]
MPLADRSRQSEQMDEADLPAADYAAVLADLAKVNRLTLAARPTLGFVRRALAGRRRLRLLDVGYGQGDMLRSIARLAAQHGIAADLVGIDLNPNSAPAARAATPAAMPIDYRTGDYADLASEGWDCIVSSLVTHHMDEAEIDAFLRFMEREAAVGWMVNDLHRHRFAYAGYPLLAGLMRWHPIVRADGRLSIERAFRPADWRVMLAAAGIEGAAVVRRFPFRLCVERLR